MKNNNTINGKQHDNTTIVTSTARLLYIRGELVSFWRLFLQHQESQCWTLRTHYLLYPNPYPKRKRWKQRWYGHASFPLLLQLGGEDIIVRSNWELYLQELSNSILIADQAWSQKADNDDKANNDDIDADAAADAATFTRNNNYARPYVQSARKGPVQRKTVVEKKKTEESENQRIGWSNFERKMDAVGEATFELHLKRSQH